MKTSLVIAAGISLATLLFAAEVVPRGAIDWENMPVIQALQSYEDLTKAELIVDSRVKKVQHRLTLVANPTNKGDAAKVIEKALLDQAGIVVTPLGEKRISITYNDALPISSPKKL